MSNIKVAFFDIDGTLSVPKYDVNQELQIGGSLDWWEKANVGRQGVYRHCLPVETLKNYLRELKNQQVVLKCLTTEELADAYFNKVEFVLKHYGEFFKDYKDVIYTPNDDFKVHYLDVFKFNMGLEPSSILLVDDSYDILLHAVNKGYQVRHISEFLH